MKKRQKRQPPRRRAKAPGLRLRVKRLEAAAKQNWCEYSSERDYLSSRIADLEHNVSQARQSTEAVLDAIVDAVKAMRGKVRG